MSRHYERMSDNEMNLLTNFTSFSKSIWWTNTSECTDLIDACWSLGARIRRAIVDVDAAIVACKAGRALTSEPLIGWDACATVVAGCRGAKVGWRWVELCFAQCAIVVPGTVAAKTIDLVDTFAFVLTWTVRALVNVIFAIFTGKAGNATASIIIVVVDATGAILARFQQLAFINIWFDRAKKHKTQE